MKTPDPIRAVLGAALLLLGLLLTGCDIQFAGQELQLRPNADGSLDVLLVYRGVSAASDGEEAVGKAQAIAHGFLEGRRRFAVPIWPGAVDLDNPETYQGLDEETVNVLQGISLEESGVFEDPQGHLSAYQRLRVPDVGRAIECWNRWISASILAEAEEAHTDEPSEVDDRTRQLWIERAHSGEPWIRFQDGLVVLDLPLTRATADRLQRGLIDEVAKAGGDMGGLAGVLSHLRQVSIGDESLFLAFGAPGTGVFKLVFDDPKAEYRPGLSDALAAEGIHPHPGVTLEQVRDLLRN